MRGDCLVGIEERFGVYRAEFSEMVCRVVLPVFRMVLLAEELFLTLVRDVPLARELFSRYLTLGRVTGLDGYHP